MRWSMAAGPGAHMRDAGYINLDPQAEALLSLMAGSSAESIRSMPLSMLRTMLNESMKAFTSRSVAVAESRDLTVRGPAGRIPVRVYTPLGGGPGPLPGLVFFHGGGFLAGHLDTHDGLCRALANESGCRVLAAGYRLAPEHKFPAAVEDAFAVTSWVAENAEDVGADPARLAVGGDSAGGTLAAVVCQLARAAGRPTLAAQMLLYPMTQLDADTGSRRSFTRAFLVEEQVLRRCAEFYLGSRGDAHDPRVSPLLAEDLSRLPRAIIVTAGLDPFKDEAMLYAQRLRFCGVDTRHLNYERMFHGFLNACGVLDAARSALREIASTLGARLA